MIPYSVVQPVWVQTKRPVIFSPSILSRGLIERLLQPAQSGLTFDTCSPGTRLSRRPSSAAGTAEKKRNKRAPPLTATRLPLFAEPIPAPERRDKAVFLLDPCSPEQAEGVRLQAIQEVISQVSCLRPSSS